MRYVLSFAFFGIAFPVAVFSSPSSIFNLKDYGAIGDGTRLETESFAKAIADCSSHGGGVVYVPPGRYLTGTIELKSHVTLEVGAGAVVLGSENPEDYPATKSIWGDGREVMAPLIYAHDAEDIGLKGRGIVDGQGKIWWRRLELARPRRDSKGPATAEEEAEAAKIKRGRPHLIRPVHCKNVVIEDISLRNSAEWNIHPMLCEWIRISGVSIYADVGSHNTDGINPECCTDVHISNCRIDTGDDCVTLKSGLDELGRRMGQPDQNITITNCVMYRGHGGVTIGSEMSGGVRNVAISNCVFQGTDIGIRIKSQRGRGGIVEGVAADNIVMQDVPTPFVITTFYTGADKPEDIHPVDQGTPQYRDFIFSNITARGAKVAGSITGLREMPIENITFTNVHIQATSGFVITNADHIVFNDSVIDTEKGASVILNDKAQAETTRLRSNKTHEGVPLVQGGVAAAK